MTPLLRVAGVGAAGLALLLTGGGVAYYVARHPSEADPTRSRVASPPATHASLPGDRMMGL